MIEWPLDACKSILRMVSGWAVEQYRGLTCGLRASDVLLRVQEVIAGCCVQDPQRINE